MTGKQILEEEFEKAGIRGYKADQVDAFLQKVAAYVDEQEVEKNDLTYKIKILAEKIEEYKADEENIRDALLGAQKLGASILNEAKSKAEGIGREAKSSYEEMMAQAKQKIDTMSKESLHKLNVELSEAKKECEKERSNLDKVKKEVSVFKASILKQYKAHLDLLSNLPSISDDNKNETVDKDTKKEIEPEISEDNDNSSSSAETITSSILTNTKELDDEKMEQTKEFEKNTVEKQSSEENDKKDKENKEHQRPNYMEKFGELKFGGFQKSNK